MVIGSETNVIEFKPWEVVQFPWGAAVRHSKGKWTHVFIGESEIDLNGMEVALHDNGIEFL